MPVKLPFKKTVKLSTLSKKKKSGIKFKKGRSSTTFGKLKSKKKKQKIEKVETEIVEFESSPEFYLEENGCSKQQAEIIMNLGFLPLYANRWNRVEAIDDLFETQKNCRGLFYDNNNAMLEKMAEDSDFEDEIKLILEKTSEQMELSRQEIELLGDIRRKVNLIKRSLDLKMIGPDLVDRINTRSKLMFEKRADQLKERIAAAEAKADAASSAASNNNNPPPPPSMPSSLRKRPPSPAGYAHTFRANALKRQLKHLKNYQLGEFHELWAPDLGFRENSYQNFSNTKLLAQLITDMKLAMTINTQQLMSENHRGRWKDKHPFAVSENTATGRGGKRLFFLSSYQTDKKAKYEVWVDLMKKLPKSSTSRVKILCNQLSREMRVSLSLSSDRGQEAVEDAELTNTSGDEMFAEIFGEAAAFLSEKTEMDGLSSILRLDTTEGVILPFEPGFVYSSDGLSKFEPGSSALADEILTSGALDHENLMNFTADFIEEVGKARTTVRVLNNLSRLPRGSTGAHEIGLVGFRFGGVQLYTYLLRRIRPIMKKAGIHLVGVTMPGVQWGDIGAFLYILDKAGNNNRLRYALFKYTQVLRHFVIVKENEALAEALGENEDAQKELEMANIKARMLDPGYNSALLQAKLDALSLEVETEEAESALDVDINSLETSTQVQDALEAIVDEVLDISFRDAKQSNPGNARTSGAPPMPPWSGKAPPPPPKSGTVKFNTGASGIGTISERRQGEVWHTSTAHRFNTLEVRESLLDTESRAAKMFLRLFSTARRLKRMGKSYRDQAMMTEAYREARNGGFTRQIRTLKGMAKASDRAAKKYKKYAGMSKKQLRKAHGYSGKKGKKGRRSRRKARRWARKMKRQAASRQQGAEKFAQMNKDRAAHLQMAQNARRRNMIDKLPDFFESSDPGETRGTTHNDVSEDVFDMLIFDIMLSLIGKLIELRVERVVEIAGISMPSSIPPPPPSSLPPPPPPAEDPATAGVIAIPPSKDITFGINATRTRCGHYAVQYCTSRSGMKKANNFADDLEDIELEMYDEILNDLQSIKERLSSERRLLRNGFTMLEEYGDHLYRRARRTHDFFNVADDPNGSEHKKLMKALMDAKKPGALVLAALNKQQLSMMHYATECFGELPKDSGKCPFPSYKMISKEQIALTEGILKSKRFTSRRGKNLNILSVGLPAGCIKHLSLEEFTDSAKAQRYDPYNKNKMLRIKVYKRDVQFDDIVFRPQVYYFDPNRYFSPLDSFSDLEPGLTYKEIVQRLKFIEYNSQGRIKKDGETVGEVVGSDDFRVLPKRKKNKCIANMIESEALKIYVKMLTGIDLNEQAFPLDPNGIQFFEKDSKNPATISAVKSLFLEQEDIESEAGFLEETARLKQLTHFAESTLFKGQSLRSEAMSPNLFERIYCLPVDPDDYVIDVGATLSTRAGRRSWAEAKRSRLIRRIKRRSRRRSSQTRTRSSYAYKLKSRPKKEGAVAIYEYFISVEVLTSSRSSRSIEAKEKMAEPTAKPESYSYEPGEN
jgi:hypothetical protein